jgi:hypothetical protein
LGKAVYHVEGVIFSYTPGESGVDSWTKIKQVPKARVLAYIDGSWRHLVRWRKAGASDSKSTSTSDAEWKPLLDLSTMHAVPKRVRELERQGEKESRRMWEPVTSRLEKKEFGEATKHKQVIEQKQRDEREERKKKGIEWVFSLDFIFFPFFPCGVFKFQEARSRR